MALTNAKSSTLYVENMGHVMLLDGEVIKEMEKEEINKYLGVVESVTIKHMEMKKKTMSIFKKRLKSILNTELNAKNTMIAVGEYALPVLTYTFGILNWTEEEIKGIDITIRKNLNLFGMFPIRQIKPTKMHGGSRPCICKGQLQMHHG